MEFITFGILLLVFIFGQINKLNCAPSPNGPWRGQYTQSSYYYSDYTLPKTTPKKNFLPGPQFCPETGRTVCAYAKPYYPLDEVFYVIQEAKARRFNLSSEFMDESDYDDEPQLNQVEPEPEYGPPKHKGYMVFQTVQYDNYPQNYENNNNFRANNYVPHQQSTPNYLTNQFNNYNPNQNQNQNQYNRDQNIQNNYGQTQYQPQQQQGYASNQMPVFTVNGYGNYHQQNLGRYKRQINEDTNEICSSRTILVEPKAALNDRGQWKYIINLAEKDPRLKQAIKVEVCANPNSQCSNQISLPFGFTSRCRQKYIKKKLLALDASGQSTSSENFFAPSCCVCEIVRNNRRK